MDPKVRELLNKVKESALTYGKAGVKFASETAERARLNLQIFDLNTEIDIAYKEIGKLVYAMHAGDEVCSEAVQSQIEAIDSRRAQIAELRARLSSFKAKPAEEKAEECCCCGEVECYCEEEAECFEEEVECCDEKAEEPCCDEKKD
ncbi:MAG: hypothetical protein GX929_08215 [Clostridiales bacterium]|jgi:hypothetical protein|nr:hypothetical protein [Clostridiales bacterium]